MIKIIINLIYKIISILDYIDFNLIHHKNLIDNYKTIDSYDVNNFEILTDDGFKPLSHIMLSKPFEQYIIKLENNYILNCADEHIVFDSNYNEIFVKNLKIGDYIQTDCGPQKILSININRNLYYFSSHTSITRSPQYSIFFSTFFIPDSKSLTMSF